MYDPSCLVSGRAGQWRQIRFKNLVRYSKSGDGDDITTFIGRQLNGSLTWEYLDEIRKEWDSPLIVKGILNADDAQSRRLRRGQTGW